MAKNKKQKKTILIEKHSLHKNMCILFIKTEDVPEEYH